MTIDKYGTKHVQEYLIDILADIDKLCRDNNIEYSLMGGGLLGTIRHNGFVPWDDDLDIIFSRDNYEKFLKVCGEKLPSQYTIIGSIWVKRITRKDNPRIENEEGCIDLFVFDNIPENGVVRASKNLIIKILQGMLKKERHYKGLSILQKIAMAGTHCFGLLFPKELKLSWYDKVSQWGNNSECDYVNNYVTYYKMVSTMKYKKADTLRYMNADFEGKKVMIFENYDSILKTQFGDYMMLPPEEKRKPTHIHCS